MSQNDLSGEDVTKVNRRKILRIIGTGGIVGTVGVGQVAGQPPNGEQGPAEKCECPDDTTVLAKYDFEDCEFELVEGSNVIDITNWESKQGEECEPITVDYIPEGVLVEAICAFGGRDTDTVTDPNRAYQSGLENPGGQRAAISNITICGETALECFQIDVVGGEVIEDFSQTSSYTQQDRLIQVIDVCSDDEEPTVRSGPVTKTVEVDGEDCTFTFENFGFDPTKMEATVDLTFDGGESDPSECKGTLAGYLLPEGEEEGGSDNLDEQELRAYDTKTIVEGQTETLKIDLEQ